MSSLGTTFTTRPAAQGGRSCAPSFPPLAMEGAPSLWEPPSWRGPPKRFNHPVPPSVSCNHPGPDVPSLTYRKEQSWAQ